MTKNLYDSIRDALSNDAVIAAKGGVVASTLDNLPGRQIKCDLADFPIRVYPFGFSQTAGAGVLNPDGYFAITLRFSERARMNGRGEDFLDIGLRIVELLHRSRHDEQSVLLSKNIIAHSSFILQNSNRRINVKVAENEMVQVMFFWTNPASLADLESASSETSDSSSDNDSSQSTMGVSPISSSSTSTDNTDAIRALSFAYDLFP